MSFFNLFFSKLLLPSTASFSSTHGNWIKIGLTLILLCTAIFFLFQGLGHYALWDDEATTGLFARNVWQTGDTSAVVGHNIIAFRSGSELENLKNRYVPPASYYVAAPFAGLLELTAFTARLPFAICGFLTTLLLVFWMWTDRASLQIWILMILGILSNVSFFLYNRQARYYGLAILLANGLAYLYTHLSQRKYALVGFSFVSVFLFATNYLIWVGCFVSGLLDYLLWERKYSKFSFIQWGVTLAPTALLGGWILSIWNPLAKKVVNETSSHWFIDKATLLWWNFRDLNAAEFGVGLLILAVPLIAIIRKDQQLLRGFTALCAFICTITILSPQPVSLTSWADIRYLIPLVPLCIWLSVSVINRISFNHLWVSVPLAILAFGTNVLHGGFLRAEGIRSSVWEYTKEIQTLRTTAYSAAANWVKTHIKPGESIWVLPDYTTYPLMFHAPHAIYSWQLNFPPEEQFAHLPLIHFKGKTPPNYILVFGPIVSEVIKQLEIWKKAGLHYQSHAWLDIYWNDMTRPELFLRSSTPITEFNKGHEAIYIFKHQP